MTVSQDTLQGILRVWSQLLEKQQEKAATFVPCLIASCKPDGPLTETGGRAKWTIWPHPAGHFLDDA